MACPLFNFAADELEKTIKKKSNLILAVTIFEGGKLQ